MQGVGDSIILNKSLQAQSTPKRLATELHSCCQDVPVRNVDAHCSGQANYV